MESAAATDSTPRVRYYQKLEVNSSVIRWMGFDPLNNVLWVGFDGRSYAYSKVPRRVFHEFLHADSKGRYFNHYIKGQYERV
jgi:hypothetical protein